MGTTLGKWTLTKVESLKQTDLGALPGSMGAKKVKHLLQRLACRALTDIETISASLPRKAKQHTALLERVGKSKIMTVGGDAVRYTARWDKDA